MEASPEPHSDDGTTKEASMDYTGSIMSNDDIERPMPDIQSSTEEAKDLDVDTERIMQELSPSGNHADTEDHDIEKLLLEIKKSTDFGTSTDGALSEKGENDKDAHESDSKYFADAGVDIESVVGSSVLDDIPKYEGNTDADPVKTDDLSDVNSAFHALRGEFDSIAADTKLPDTIDLKSDEIDPEALSNILGLDSRNEESIFSASELLDTNLDMPDVATKSDISRIGEALDRELKLKETEDVIHTDIHEQKTQDEEPKPSGEITDASSVPSVTKILKDEPDGSDLLPSLAGVHSPSATQTTNTAVPITEIKSPTLHNEIESLPLSAKMELDHNLPENEYDTGGDMTFSKPEMRNELVPLILHTNEFQSAHKKQITESDTLNGPTSTELQLKNGQQAVPTSNILSVPHEQPTIFAYARLDFQSFTFYVQTLHAIIGRRSEHDYSYKVDVNLGPSKSISRRHAQIFYNFATRRFELSVIGKNGAFVDDKFVERGKTVPLKNRTRIQIGQIPFRFILPEQDRVIPLESQSQEQGQQETEQAANINDAQIPKIEELEDKKAVTKEGAKEEKKKRKKKETTQKTKTAKSRATTSGTGASTSSAPSTAKKGKTSKASATSSQTTTKTGTDKKTTSAAAAAAAAVTKKGAATTTKKETKATKAPKKSYTIDEIPVEYRVKPPLSYSSMLITCLRKFSDGKGMTLSEIYSSIRELYPYYKYCRDGWQSSVRHNLSLNRSFQKISKEGKGWLWGLDEEYIAERERHKKQQAEAATTKAESTQQQHVDKKTTSTGKQRTTTTTATATKKRTISQTLAANRSSAAAAAKRKESDHQRTIKYLQEELITLTRDRKGLSKQVIANILTQALAMTINQVSQAAKDRSIVGNPLTVLMDKNPQHLNLILAAAVNAATAKVTNGKVKQLVSTPTLESLQRKTQKTKPQKEEKEREVKKPKIETGKKSNNSKSQARQTAGKASTTPKTSSATSSQRATKTATARTKTGVHTNTNTTSTTTATTSTTHHPAFDPSSLSRFFQPKQQQRVPRLSRSSSSTASTSTSATTASASTNSKGKNKVIPLKRTHESSDSSEESSSGGSSDSDSSSTSSGSTDSSETESTSSDSETDSGNSSSSSGSDSSSSSGDSDNDSTSDSSSSGDNEESGGDNEEHKSTDKGLDTKGDEKESNVKNDGPDTSNENGNGKEEEKDEDKDKDSGNVGDNIDNKNESDKETASDVNTGGEEVQKEGNTVDESVERVVESESKEIEKEKGQEQKDEVDKQENNDSDSSHDDSDESMSDDGDNAIRDNLKIEEKKEDSDVEMVSDSEPVVPMGNTVTTTEGDLTAESESIAEKDKEEKQEEQESIDNEVTAVTSPEQIEEKEKDDDIDVDIANGTTNDDDDDNANEAKLDPIDPGFPDEVKTTETGKTADTSPEVESTLKSSDLPNIEQSDSDIGEEEI